MQARDIPNLITCARLLLVPPIVWSMLTEQYGLALLLFVAAGLSDALDGFLAKTFNWTSRLGGLLDPIADKLLLVSCYLALTWQGLLPLWLTALVIGRDVVILAGAILYNALVERVEAAPSVISKINTLSQLLLVVAVLFNYGAQLLPVGWLTLMIQGVFATTLLSGVDYIWTWGWRAWNKKHGSGRFP
ncbi:MAG: CDP-alcohol phosphatidyltransferase family protein [Gammaproteobacteria bacterium]|nr:CDP-alcohol phosphatidyltransferase family protein [Gammaproteobacteria bacterium]